MVRFSAWKMKSRAVNTSVVSAPVTLQEHLLSAYSNALVNGQLTNNRTCMTDLSTFRDEHGMGQNCKNSVFSYICPNQIIQRKIARISVCFYTLLSESRHITQQNCL
jgi:hypothetical protein